MGAVCPSDEKARRWAAPVIESTRRAYIQSTENPAPKKAPEPVTETKIYQAGEAVRTGDGELIQGTGRRRGPNIGDGWSVRVGPAEGMAPKRLSRKDRAVRDVIRGMARVPEFKQRLLTIALGTLPSDKKEAAYQKIVDEWCMKNVGGNILKVLAPREKKVIVSG